MNNFGAHGRKGVAHTVTKSGLAQDATTTPSFSSNARVARSGAGLYALPAVFVLVLSIALLLSACGSKDGDPQRPGGDTGASASSAPVAEGNADSVTGQTMDGERNVHRPSLTIPTSSPLTGPEPGQFKKIKMASGRTFILQLPADYDPSKQWPLVLAFHGWKETAEAMHEYSHFSAAEAIVVFAQGEDKAWAPAPYATSTGAQDQAYVREIIDSVRATYTVDDARIHAVGMSNGGGFAVYLACTMPEYFTSIASVSAAYYEAILKECNPAPVGRLDIHGTDDPVVGYFGGTRHGAKYFPVMDVLEADRQRNQCSDTVSTTRLGSSALRMQWRGCAAPLVHVRIGGGTHVWPGGKYDPDQAIPRGFASDMVLDFFAIPGREQGTENSANAGTH